ncbi:winged helix-turn-helix transcriptional regulator [Candidatus Dependentiae bacterium]|nr:winged helix-turn-helix transcriptional regulator [Candidatus Dependentiae bacterium]
MSNLNFKHISAHEKPEQSPGFLLWHVSTAWRSSIEAVLKLLDLTHPQFVVLATLGWLTRNGDRITQAALCTMTGIDPNTTSQILRGLEAKKLIKRVPSLDPRAKNPMLTAKGSELLIKALPAVEEADGQFFKELTEKESIAMLSIFQKLIAK